MRIRLTTDDAFEGFQFWWHALVFGGRARDPVVVSLMRRLARISRPGPDAFSRVLLRPCEVELSDLDRGVLLNCFARTDWQEDKFEYVARACRLFGAGVDRGGTALPEPRRGAQA
jgi:hypothetical protein